jgi:hypothetical protein
MNSKGLFHREEMKMKIEVKEARVVASNIVVDFLSDYGEATAIWDGDSPTEDCEYQVEVDIEEALSWGEDAIISETNEYSVRMCGNSIVFVGILDSTEDDGYTVVRIGEGIIPFITKGIPVTVGSFVQVISKTVTLTPINYF